MASAEPPVIVGMSTLPSRIGKIRPAIDSLLDNTRPPDRIVLSVPRKPLRGPAELTIPEFLGEGAYRDRVLVNMLEEDYGPGSKVLGCLPHMPGPCIVILADDDMEYRDFFIDTLGTAQTGNPDRSFSFYAYRFKGLSIGQGADGFSFTSANLRGIDDFFSRHVRGTRLVFHDDLWISWFLALKGIAVVDLQHRLEGDLVYRSVHSDGALKDLESDFARERLAAEGLDQLRRSAPLPRARDLAIRLRGLSDRVADAAARRLGIA